MGNCLQHIINVYQRRKLIKKNIVLLMTGVDNAGKTSVLNCIANEPDENVMSTMGFRVVTLRHKLHSIKVYDVGGARQIRSIWKKYYSDIHGLIYVVDASDLSRLNENKLIFGELISHEQIAGKPILLLANKQDLTGAIDELDLVENLDVERTVNSMRCPTRVETCSCVFDQKYLKQNIQGIINGYKWLLETIIKNYSTLEERISASQTLISSINNNNFINQRSRSSISSITSFRVPINSNPFKPINELVANIQNNTASNRQFNNNKDDKKDYTIRKFLARNKTTTAINESTIITMDNVEPFNENENNDEVAFVTLDPLNLMSQHVMRARHMRPFTAPASSQIASTFTIPNIPGQVPPA